MEGNLTRRGYYRERGASNKSMQGGEERVWKRDGTEEIISGRKNKRKRRYGIERV